MSTPLNNSILKGFDILALFTHEAHEISTATVTKKLGMNTATAHRFLMTLDRAGAIRSTRRGRFALGPRIEELGQITARRRTLAALVQPTLDALCGELGESIMACRLAQHGPSCIAYANSNRPISLQVREGALLPFHTTAQGYLWLAEMPEDERRERLESASFASLEKPDLAAVETRIQRVYAQGYATNEGDNEPDLGAVAVPVRNIDGQMVLSMSVFGMLRRFDGAFIDRARAALLDAAASVAPEL
ncbi:Pca regulon regulatory protein PcaR [Candidatus Rhodobacter oscarellae]|uniref:Pca regulon regulatory protein PcaR n=1 Tax=Candidatus Rhodobacter oscarellae TaxID=1675527 RepID=A0A0J9ED24_9RHOB|nr:IclR family transcriptional regulator [Candidatus Rhodobacter lobularis]KMW59619.1 Pca regulon regulatory protein PcaR [Candidatus Rhodobacter lobularis]